MNIWFEFGEQGTKHDTLQYMRDDIKYWDNILLCNKQKLHAGFKKKEYAQIIEKYNVAIQASQCIINHMILEYKY